MPNQDKRFINDIVRPKLIQPLLWWILVAVLIVFLLIIGFPMLAMSLVMTYAFLWTVYWIVVASHWVKHGSDKPYPKTFREFCRRGP